MHVNHEKLASLADDIIEEAERLRIHEPGHELLKRKQEILAIANYEFELLEDMGFFSEFTPEECDYEQAMVEFLALLENARIEAEEAAIDGNTVPVESEPVGA